MNLDESLIGKKYKGKTIKNAQMADNMAAISLTLEGLDEQVSIISFSEAIELVEKE